MPSTAHSALRPLRPLRPLLPLARCSLAGLGLAGLAGLAALLLPLAAAAQDFPQRPIRLLVPLAAGSTADIVSRFAGQELAKLLGQPVVIENKPAAGGTVAMGDLARAAPDGHTIAFASQGTLVFNQAIYNKPGYDSIKDFRPVTLIGGVSNVMIVPPASTARAPADIVTQAKAKPGQVTFSSGGAGTSHHLSGVLFARQTATDLLHVPYKGAPQGILAVMSGEVAVGFFNTPTVISQVKDGKLRALGVTSLKRSPLLPDVPTLAESGLKGFDADQWFVVATGANAPVERLTALNDAINRALQNPEVQAALAKAGIASAPASPQQTTEAVGRDYARWQALVKKANLPLE